MTHIDSVKTFVAPLISCDDLRLHKRCRQIGRVSSDVRELFERLVATMHAAPGVGLAAPQIGDMRRACVIEADGQLLFMANPVVLHTGNAMVWSEEGCLSFPGVGVRVLRHERVRVGFIDYHGKAREEMLGGLLSIAAQHEIDHLDGVLFFARGYQSGMGAFGPSTAPAVRRPQAVATTNPEEKP